jgi:apolipoprotein N-acyltransferase
MMLGSTPIRRLLLAMMSGVAYALAFPPFDHGAVAFVALVPLLVAVRGASRAIAAALGWVTGTIACSVLVGPSVYTAAARYFGEAPALAVLLAAVIPQLYGALYFALFGLCACEIGERCGPLAAVLTLPTAWVACEMLRAHVGYGAPWILLAHAAHAWPWLLQVSDLGGAAAVSWVVALVNAGMAALLLYGRAAARARVAGVAVVVAILAGVWVYGERQLARWSAPPATTLRVAVVQGDVPAAWRSSLVHVSDTLARYGDLMRRVPPHTDLVVWPENAVSVSVDVNADALAAATMDLDPDARLLIGAPRAVATSPARSEVRDSALLVDRQGHVTGVYDKLRLTPYGEFVPWLARPFAAADRPQSVGYSAGEVTAPLQVAGRRFATLICYEAIYADLVRRAVRDGAEFLVNISNDDWFAGAPAVVQHFHAAQLRAVESRRFLVRATNTGISAIVDPRGAIVAAAPRGEPATLTAVIGAIAERSVYVRTGDAFGWLCVAVALGAVLVGRRV